MNKLLHAADMYLSYKRGKETGLWGLVGIFLAIVLAASWKYIQPLFEKIGLVAFFDRIGLIREGAPALTAIFIIVYCTIAVYIFFLIIFIVIMLFTLFINLINRIGEKTNDGVKLSAMMTFTNLILFPLVIIYAVFYTMILLPRSIKDFLKEFPERRRDSEGFKARKKEENRLAKNRDLINYLKFKMVQLNSSEEQFFTEADKLIPEESVILTVEQAAQRLNRLPIQGDHFFLIGISYERDTYLLIPRPQTPYNVQTPNSFIGEKWNFYTSHRLEYDYFGTKLNRPTYGIMWALTKFERVCEYPKLPDRAEFNHEKHKMHEYDMDMFEFIIDPREHYDIMSELKEYLKYCHYQHYIKEQQDLYFKNKQKLLEKMDKAESREEFMMYASELKEFNANNEDVVKMIWEGNQNKIKG